MNDTLHANIFFFITSVAVIVVTLMLVVALWYVIHILRELRMITLRARLASEKLEDEIEYFRQEFRSGGIKIMSMLSNVVGFAVGRMGGIKKRPTPRKRTTSATETEKSV